jgi:[ribosomal protein S5]-alanine N-acetyltransferase
MRRLPPIQPILTTPRLRLRVLVADDGDAVAALQNDREVAQYLLHVPHPYPRELADEWIAGAIDDWGAGSPTWAVTRKRSGKMIGAVWLRWQPRHDRAELGYWIGRAYWGHGFGREAVAVAVDFGFDVLETQRVYAQHLGGNDRSGDLLQAVGMRCEGVRRQHIKKSDRYFDVSTYGILRADRP